MKNNTYLTFLRSWFWIIALGILVSAVATHYALSQRVPLYRTTATVQIGRTLENKNPSQDDLAVIERLVPAYGEMAQRDPVLNATIETLGLPLDAENIRERLLVTPVPRTQLIDIHVIDADPDVAAAIANEIARQVVLQSPDTARDDSISAFIQVELDDLQAKITNAREESVALESEILSMTSAADVFDARERLTLINAQIDTWQQTYGTLVLAVEPSTSNIISMANAATSPADPMPAQSSLYYGLAVVAGGGLGTLLALGLSAIGRSIRNADELAKLAGSIPVVTIPRYRVRPTGLPVTLAEPDSSATGAYRILRNTLQTVQLNSGATSLMVTSSRTGEGKTTTVANLGAALANTGLKVVLVDTNFRNPELDDLFGMENQFGLSDLLLGNAKPSDVIEMTGHPNLSLIGVGGVPPNYSDLLSSSRLGAVVADIRAAGDVVIFDTAAVQQEEETQLLTRHVDRVLVLAEAGRVNSDDLRHTLSVLERANANVVSIVLNKTQQRDWNWSRFPWSREARRLTAATHRRAIRARIVQSEPSSSDGRQSVTSAD